MLKYEYGGRVCCEKDSFNRFRALERLIKKKRGIMNGRSQSTQTVCLNLIRVHSDAQAGQTIGFVVADRVTAVALAFMRFNVNLYNDK